MEKETQYAKAKLAEKLGASSLGYYTWLQEREKRQKDQKALEDKVVTIFRDGRGTYGVDRICGIIRRDGEPASYQVVRRIIQQKSFEILSPYPQTTFADR